MSSLIVNRLGVCALYEQVAQYYCVSVNDKDRKVAYYRYVKYAYLKLVRFSALFVKGIRITNSDFIVRA